MNRIWHCLLLTLLLSSANLSQAQSHDVEAANAQPLTPATTEAVTAELAETSAETLSQDGIESHAQATTPDTASSDTAQLLFAPQAFRAEYKAIYNDDRIGRAWLTTTLEDDIFHTQYRMKATRGFASFVGANLREQGRYAWSDNTIIPLYFKHRSKAFLSKKKWHANFDALNGRVTGEYEGDEYDLPFEPSLLDPQTQLVYGAQLSAQLLIMPETQSAAADTPDHEGDFASVVKGELRNYHYALFRDQPLSTDCGEFSTVRLLRTRAESTATQEMWYAPELDWLMVRMKIVQRDGDVLDMVLSGAELSGTLACGAFEDDD
ncbi:MAG: DUF3108 domain-containing protein [Xanthomonadales bacterium]|nr:DUF3108 domain-containing protein [Xanthomonadales bacterium]